MDAITTPPRPSNEPVHSYAPGSPERARIVDELARRRQDGAEAGQRRIEQRGA